MSLTEVRHRLLPLISLRLEDIPFHFVWKTLSCTALKWAFLYGPAPKRSQSLSNVEFQCMPSTLSNTFAASISNAQEKDAFRPSLLNQELLEQAIPCDFGAKTINLRPSHNNCSPNGAISFEPRAQDS